MGLCVCVCVCVCTPSPHTQAPSILHIGPRDENTSHIHSGRWILEEDCAYPRGRLRALWERNPRVSETQSISRSGGGAGSRSTHTLDPIQPIPFGKGTVKESQNGAFLSLQSLEGIPLALFSGGTRCKEIALYTDWFKLIWGRDQCDNILQNPTQQFHF